jgi:hypothetical protein
MSQNVTEMPKNVTLLESAGLQRIPVDHVGECKVLPRLSNPYSRLLLCPHNNPIVLFVVVGAAVEWLLFVVVE